jgi:mannose-1-phosphate guanylyltransferase
MAGCDHGNDRNAELGGLSEKDRAIIKGLDWVAVIMAGGTGTRFWPLSTSEKPKQFLKLFDDRSLLQKSVERIADLIPPERILVLTNASFVTLVREQLPQIPADNVIGEPLKRDTAAAICLGAALCRKRFGNPLMVVLTADHIIEPRHLFQKVLIFAAKAARESDALYTLGIRPTFPAVGYGYLELGERVETEGGIEHFQLRRIKEKPDGETAAAYIQSGQYLWNSGMFLWNSDTIIREIQNHLPDHWRAIAEAVLHDRTPLWQEALRQAFDRVKPISIDYGVMEKATQVRCVASTFSWTDLGGWLALADFLDRDRDDNCCRGQVLTLDATGNIVFCENRDDLVMLVGVDDLVVVRAGARTLIARKDRVEEIRKLVQNLEQLP